jgi:hypothetical protein
VSDSPMNLELARTGKFIEGTNLGWPGSECNLPRLKRNVGRAAGARQDPG